MMKPERKPEIFSLLDPLAAYLKQTREVGKALRYTLRAARRHFSAEAGCIAAIRPGRAMAEVMLGLPDGRTWDLALLSAFIRNEHPEVPHGMVVSPLRRRGRDWAAMALSRPAPFEKGAGRMMNRVSAALSDSIEMIDREHALDVRARIDRKVLEELRPKDLFYQILHGLRSLTRYDHSSALLIRDDEGGTLKLEAEQIAWIKGKSSRIGVRLPLTDEIQTLLDSEEVCGFDRETDGWREWKGRPVAALARLLDYNIEGDGLREASMICAPLPTRDGVLGVLKIAARHAGSFGAYEAALVEGFRSQAAVAIRNSQRTETLQARMLEAERKHAMADLARGVSHDVNNAMGSILPLVQQMQEDLSSGPPDPDVFRRDLEQIEGSLKLCQRIFGGMLTLARGGARRTAQGQVRLAAESTLAILKDSIERRGIELFLEIPDQLPAVNGGQSDLDQVFLNLLTNARDATPAGGRIAVRARSADNSVEIVIEDTGHGIPREHLARVEEPFFTTKPDGSGLGLSICRSIIWQMGGSLGLESEPGKGTKVRLLVPQAPGKEQGDRA
jgi:signal transduction histidine kinase